MATRTLDQIDHELRAASVKLNVAEGRGEYGRLSGLQKDLDDLLEERSELLHDSEGADE